MIIGLKKFSMCLGKQISLTDILQSSFQILSKPYFPKDGIKSEKRKEKITSCISGLPTGTVIILLSVACNEF